MGVVSGGQVEGAWLEAVVRVMHSKEEASALNRDRRKAQPRRSDDEDDADDSSASLPSQPPSASSVPSAAAPPTSLTILCMAAGVGRWDGVCW